MTTSETISNGGCLCGAVRYRVQGPLRDVVYCHCGMCRRLFGSAGAHSKAPKNKIHIDLDQGLTWFPTSDIARRGFCGKCGSQLFWVPFEQDATGIVAGSLDQPTGLKTIGHIFTGEKADFHEIADGTPCFEASSAGGLPGDYR